MKMSGAVLSVLGSLVLTGSLAMGQTQLLPTNPTSFTFYTGGGLATAGVVTVTPPYGASFTQAWDVNVTHTDTPHDVRVYAATSQSVTAGDALVATVWYRRTDGQLPTALPNNPSLEPNEANITAVFSQASGATTSASIALRGRTQWRSVSVPFVAVSTGVGQFEVDFAAATQDVQVAGMQVIDYGQESVLSTTSPVDDTAAFTLSNNNGTWGSVSTIAVTGEPFTQADKVTVSTAPGFANSNECNLNANLTKPIKSGDTLVILVWLKRDSGSNQNNMGISGYNWGLESNSTVVPASFPPLIVETAWKQFYLVLTAPQAYLETASNNTAQLQIVFGAAAQSIDVAGLQVLDLGTSVAAASLTNNQIDYPGRNLSDPWQAAAQTRIQQYRMGNLNVNVLSNTGAPLSNVAITANMTKHHFKFGSWENWSQFLGNGPTQPKNSVVQGVWSQYTNNVPNTNAFFNTYTEGSYKWYSWYGGDEALANTINTYLHTNGIFNIRGHNLVWPNYLQSNYVPPNVPGMPASQLGPYVLSHIDQEAGDMTNASPNQQVTGLVTSWDVVNEPWTSRSIQAVLSGASSTGTTNLSAVTPAVSATYLTQWFNETFKADTAPALFVNDDGVELNYARVVPEVASSSPEEYDYEILTNMVSDGAVLDGYGFESHFQYGKNVTDPITEKAIFDRYGAINASSGPLAEHITEYDPQFTDQGLQADYMSDYLTLAFSEPNFDAFMLYGFWAGVGTNVDFPSANKTMLPGTPANTTNWYGNVFNTDWSVSPSGEAYLGLVKGKWWTRNATATSNGSGVATINGFLGRYAVTASYGDVTKTYYVDLPSTAGATLNMQLDGSGGAYNCWVYDTAESPHIYQQLMPKQVTGAVNGWATTSTNGAVAFVPPGEAQGPQQCRIDTEAYGSVHIWLRAIAPSGSAYKFYIGVDGPATSTLSLPVSTTWKWSSWNGTTTLAAGMAHYINLNYNQAGATIDQILITDDPNFVPTY